MIFVRLAEIKIADGYGKVGRGNKGFIKGFLWICKGKLVIIEVTKLSKTATFKLEF